MTKSSYFKRSSSDSLSKQRLSLLTKEKLNFVETLDQKSLKNKDSIAVSPTISPTEEITPTLQPTEELVVPTDTPTYFPTYSPYPILSFSTYITLSGLTSVDLPTNSQDAFILAESNTLGISNSDIEFVGLVYDDDDTRRRLKEKSKITHPSKNHDFESDLSPTLSPTIYRTSDKIAHHSRTQSDDQIPTLNPTPSPTDAEVDDFVPTAKPTRSPTVAEDDDFVPTAKPTRSPTVAEDDNVVTTNSPTYSPSSRHKNVDDDDDIPSTLAPTSSPTTLEKMRLQTKILIPLNASTSTDHAKLIYKSLTATLKTAVETSEFTTTLQEASSTLNDTTLSSVSATGISVSKYSLFIAPTNSPTEYPTSIPTSNPTGIPTSHPTLFPTLSPDIINSTSIVGITVAVTTFSVVLFLIFRFYFALRPHFETAKKLEYA